MIVAETLTAVAVLSGCEGDEPQAGRPTAPQAADTAGSCAPSGAGDRGYSPQQVRLGRDVYRENCASCHGRMAQGAGNWRRRDESGDFPPPPLNGSGHAWHHPFPMLRRIVAEGGAQNMPAWGDPGATPVGRASPRGGGRGRRPQPLLRPGAPRGLQGQHPRAVRKTRSRSSLAGSPIGFLTRIR